MNTLSTTLLSLAFLATSNIVSAEDITVEINGSETGVSSSVYYNLETGESQILQNDDWDLAFSSTGAQSAFIQTNRRYSVFVVPDADFDIFGTEIDTTGMVETWEQSFNDSERWGYGSFNLGKDGFADGDGDYGWGDYNFGNHNVVGDKVFVITDFDKNTFQVVIDGLYDGIFKFLWADLSGANQSEGEVINDATANTLMTFYDFETGEKIKMPELGTWDIVFEKYVGFLPEMDAHYPVTGIRTSPSIRVAEIESVDPLAEKAPTYPSDAWLTSNTEIGHDWKILNEQFTYDMKDGITYFIQKVDSEENPIGDPFKFIPKSYGGNVFVFSLNETDTGGFVSSNIPSINLAPNVVSAGESIVLPSSMTTVTISVYDMQGNVVLNQSSNSIDTTELVSGNYFVVIDGAGKIKSSRFVVK